MEKRVSRMKNRLVAIGFGVFLFMLLVSSYIHWNWMTVVAYAVFFGSAILLIATNRCPCCGYHFRGVFWSKSAGICQKCGEKILFDDEEK